MLNIYDVLMSPSKVVEAGEPLFVSVRIENLGDELEEDIKAEILDYFDEQIVYLENQYQDEATKEELRKIKRFKKYMEKK